MQYGLNLPNGGAWGDARTLADLAHLAEEVGWDGVFLEDYIVWQSHQDVPTYDPWIALAAIALRTEHIRFGTAITPLTRRRPWKVARETVTLDHLSKGRLILGVGLGDVGDNVSTDVSFTHFGEVINARQRAQRLDEALDVLVGLWSGQPFSYQGEHYRVNEVTLLPRPVQTPRIPIWIGGGWPLKGPARRAARWDGSCMYKHAYGGPWEDWTPDDVRALKAFVDSRRGASTPFDIALGGRDRDADWDKERALIGSLAEAGATWWIEYIPPDVGGLGEARERIERGPLRID
jgi:alkanesulfonate monooxygenase SsuD/methylene tetrahydromethanopterin reductase-like flavin-dependent oxidoreductase (luciferase family)